MSQGSAAIGSWENAGEKACDQMYQALNKASSKILELKNCTFKKSRHCFSLDCISVPSTCFYNRNRIDGPHSISISINGLLGRREEINRLSEDNLHSDLRSRRTLPICQIIVYTFFKLQYLKSPLRSTYCKDVGSRFLSSCNR